MNPLKEILTAARALISNIDRWAQMELATDNTGEQCRPNDEKAYAFCANGALCKAAGGFMLPSGEPNPVYTAAFNAVNHAAHRLFEMDIFKLNDEGYDGVEDRIERHATVLEVFDAAIADAWPV